MTVRSKPKNHCPRCGMRAVLCLCAEAPRLELKTRVTVIMHWREVPKTTNTARLALLALPNGEIRVRGARDLPMKSEGLVTSEYQTLLLFPSEEAQTLTPELLNSYGKPIHLLVPDGNWPQARKVSTREEALRGVPRVKLPPGKPSSYQLRRSPHPENLSTFEAIARTLGMIEGEKVQTELEDLFEKAIERVLWTRGKIRLAQCRYPIPEVAIRSFHQDGQNSQKKAKETDQA